MKVSVLLATYNQERYIAQAIESVLVQQTGFPVELLIGEDCSTDTTRQIVEEYAKKFPTIIHPVFQEKNVGGTHNFSSLYDLSTGDYLAVLEGDDYWTDPLKLRKQISFLEQNRDFSMCFHNVILFYQDGSKTAHTWFTPGSKQHRRFTLNDLLKGNFIQTCSVVYRRTLPRMPDWLHTLPMGDWPFHILHAENGDIGYIDDVMGVYRINPESMWMSVSQAERVRRSIKAAGMINDLLNGKYHYRLVRTIAGWYSDLVKGHLAAGDKANALQSAFESIDTINDYAAEAPYYQFYLTLFVNSIAELVEKGRMTEAIQLFDRNVQKFPHVNEIDKINTLINSFKSKLGGYEDQKSVLASSLGDTTIIPRENSLQINKTYSPGVSIVIPVFNRIDLTIQCIDSIKKYSPETPYDITIVDNGSTDSTEVDIRNLCKEMSQLHYIKMDTNRGFAPACNIGASQSDKEFVLFLNNDTIVSSDWLDSLVKIFADPEVGICGSKLLYPNRTVQHAGIFFKPDLVPFHQYAGESQSAPNVNKTIEVAAVTGACLILRKALFEEMGGMDERYGMYHEDVDFCLKAHQMGYKVIYNPKSCFVHLEQQSKTDQRAPLIQTEKSRVLFHQLWGAYLVKLMFNNRELLTEGIPYTNKTAAFLAP